MTQAQESPVFELFKNKGRVRYLKDKNNWDDMRKRFVKPDEKLLIDTKKCKKCVWANIESGKVFCSR